jgi:hypothetical protein
MELWSYLTAYLPFGLYVIPWFFVESKNTIYAYMFDSSLVEEFGIYISLFKLFYLRFMFKKKSSFSSWSTMSFLTVLSSFVNYFMRTILTMFFLDMFNFLFYFIFLSNIFPNMVLFHSFSFFLINLRFCCILNVLDPLNINRILVTSWLNALL